MNVLIATPTAGSVKATYASSLLGLVLYYLSNPIEGMEQEERRLGYELLIGGGTICQNRDHIVDSALRDDNYTHLLFLDDDMGFKPECLNIAASRKKAIVLGNYRMKTPPWDFTARNLDGDVVKTNKYSEGLEEINFGGFGFCLMERAVIEAIPRPRFLYMFNEKSQTLTTEDCAFFHRVREAGFTVHLDQDVSRRLWHVGEFAYDYVTSPRPKMSEMSSYNEPAPV